MDWWEASIPQSYAYVSLLVLISICTFLSTVPLRQLPPLATVPTFLQPHPLTLLQPHPLTLVPQLPILPLLLWMVVLTRPTALTLQLPGHSGGAMLIWPQEYQSPSPSLPPSTPVGISPNRRETVSSFPPTPQLRGTWYYWMRWRGCFSQSLPTCGP